MAIAKGNSCEAHNAPWPGDFLDAGPGPRSMAHGKILAKTHASMCLARIQHGMGTGTRPGSKKSWAIFLVTALLGSKP